MTDRNDFDELTLDEAAKEFGVSRRTLERLRQQGSLPGVRRGRYLRVRCGDVRRALAFSDPVPLYRELLSVPDHVLVEEWMRGWIQLTIRMHDDPQVRECQKRWAEEASRRYGSWPVSDYHVRHAIDAADAAGIEGMVETFIQAMQGIPQDRPMLGVLRDLVPIMNPLLRFDGEDGNGRQGKDGRGDGEQPPR